MIRFENVSKEFDSEGISVAAVKDVSLEINKGEVFGIIGFSGAGKSTLVRCINLLERPTKGKVFINEKEITALSESELKEQRKKIGMIFQQFNLFSNRTVYNNVEFPLKRSKLTRRQKQEKVMRLLKLVDLEDKASAYPSQLSGGQKQRVAIARALANDPEILLSDESTSALDPKTTKSILTLLKKLNRELGITIVVITHEMQVIKDICDRVAVMKDGEVVEYGDVFDIFANPTQDITREFVEGTSNLSRIKELLENKSAITQLKQGEAILKFKYLERSASEALVSQLSRKFNLDINIIFGNIELIGDNPVGGLVSIVRGTAREIDAAIEYLKEKNVGVEGAIVPLVFGCTPFFTRQIESALADVSPGLIEAAQSMGSGKLDIIMRVYLKESISGIARATTITIISLIGLTAMAGAIGAGGLGDFAIRFGHQRNQPDVTYTTVIVLVIIVSVIQLIGNYIARKNTHE